MFFAHERARAGRGRARSTGRIGYTRERPQAAVTSGAQHQGGARGPNPTAQAADTASHSVVGRPQMGPHP
eukprot:7786714-Pyramimonas_sp.AAC.1